MPGGGSYQLGIDFGTSNTVAVVGWPDGRARPLLFEGSPLLPSAVYAEPSGALVVGRDAVQSARLQPARFEPNPKRRIDEGTLLLGDREVTVVEVIAAVLARITDEWSRTVGAVRPDVTLTCPAAWGAPRRSVLVEAAARVGFTTVRLVAEPVAAATYFAQVLGRDVPIGSVVVVHDFGAGTFDASVVARTSSGFDVLAVDGRNDIGGLDVDAGIIARLADRYGDGNPDAWARLTSPSTVEDRRAKQLLWDDVRAAKERLSRNPTADLVVPLADIEAHLTRDELEELAKPLLDQTVRVTQGVISWSNLAPGRLAGVFLVGGSSRIPLMATLLHRALGEAPVVLEQPELVVAEGSIHAGALALTVEDSAVPGPGTGVLPRIPVEAFGPAGAPSAVPAAAPAAPAAASGSSPPSTPPPAPAGAAPESAPVSPGPAAQAPAPAPAPAAAPAPAPAAAPSSAAPSSPAPAAAPSSPAPVPAAAAPAVAPSSPAPASASPPAQRSVGRVIVPGAQPPSRPRGPSGPVAPTRQLPRVDSQGAGRPAPPTGPPAMRDAPVRPGQTSRRPAGTPARQQALARPQAPAPPRPPAPRRRRGRLRRFIVRLFVTLLLIATPVIAAYVAYKLSAGEDLLPIDF